MQVPQDATEVILFLQLNDDTDSNDPIVDVLFSDASLSVKKIQPGDTSLQTVTLVGGAVGSYLANSWVHVSDGLYQFCPPDSWIVAGSFTVVEFQYAAHRPQRDIIEATAGGATTTTTTAIATSAPFFDAETLEIKLTRGDDYLTTNYRQIDITVADENSIISTGSSTAYFKAQNDDKTIAVAGNAALVEVSGVLKLRLTFNRTQTAAVAAGSFNWDAEIKDDNGLVQTQMTGRLTLSESWTDIIA